MDDERSRIEAEAVAAAVVGEHDGEALARAGRQLVVRERCDSHAREREDDPAYDRWLRMQEPVAHPARLVHAAVLMVNGADDAAVPAACASETARVLRRAYARAGVTERFRFVLLPGVGHGLGELAAHEVLAWWYRWLLEPR